MENYYFISYRINKTIYSNFFKLKINGLVFPFIFGYLGYQLYNTLTYHMKK